MVIKRIYVFDEANLQAIVDLESGEPKLVLDWSPEVSKLSILVSASKIKITEASDKPIFKFSEDIGMIIGEYIIVAILENEEKENVRKMLSRIYLNLKKEKPVSSDEIGEIVINSLTA